MLSYECIMRICAFWLPSFKTTTSSFFYLIKQEIFICVMVREKTLARDNDDNKKENDIFRDP